MCGSHQDDDDIRLKLSTDWAKDLPVASQAEIPKNVRNNAERKIKQLVGRGQKAFGQPREKAILKTRSPPLRVEELWDASIMGGVTGSARIGSRRRVKTRGELTAKGTMAWRVRSSGL